VAAYEEAVDKKDRAQEGSLGGSGLEVVISDMMVGWGIGMCDRRARTFHFARHTVFIYQIKRYNSLV
jgi:hypothetical protein